MQSSSRFLVSASILVLLSFLSAGGTFAQLNEKRITRDASGVYKGKITGGTMTWVPVTGPSIPGVGPVSPGKARVPIDQGKNSSNLKNNQIGGDGTVTVKGRTRDPKVTRGGRLIKYSGKGSAVHPGEDSSLQGAVLRGTFRDKGTKWEAAFLGSGKQVFDSGDMWVYSGRKLTGTD